MKHVILSLVFAFVTCLAYAQTFEWAKGFGGTNLEVGSSIITDTLGNVYTTGYFQGTTDFDPGPNTFNLTSLGGGDIFIAKLDSTGNFLWAKRIGGTGHDHANAIKIDSTGNIYLTGYFQQAVDFDPGVNTFTLNSVGGHEIFIAKFNGAGNFIWAKSVGGAFTDIGNALDLDTQGNIYTTGIFNGQADFDPSGNNFTLVSAGSNDIFISKLDNAGNFLWAKRMGGNSDDNGYSLALDRQGNVYTTGSFSNTVDFDPNVGVFNLSSVGLTDIFITKLDAVGNFIWAKNIGGTDYDYAYDIAMDEQENVYTTGTFQSTVDFDPNLGVFNLTSVGNDDIFITKSDSAGNFIWAKTMGGIVDDKGYSIALDAQGNVYTTGYFQNVVDFDPNLGVFTLTSVGAQDIFITKLDPSGNFFWTKAMGGTGQDQANALFIDAMSNIYSTGLFEGTVDFNPSLGIYNLSSVGNKDIFVHKMFDCIESYDTLTAIACDSFSINGQTFTTSGVYNQVLTNAIGCDSVLTLDISINHTSYHTLTANICDFYIANGQTYTMSGTYTQTLTNVNGCDSLLTIILNIYHSSFDTLTQIACDSLIINGHSYTSSGVYTQTYLNAIGCDSILTLNLSINHSTDSTINEIACDTFTFNAQTYTSSGTYTHFFTNSNNCDSTVYLNLVISNFGTDTMIATACQYYLLNGQTYTSSGIYTQAIAGCDSAITLILTLNTPSSDTTTQTACNSYTLHGQTYYSSGVYLQTLTNAQGCDSILTLDLTIKNNTTNHLYYTVCDSFTLNGQTYTTSGIYTQTLTNAAGCDSLLMLNLNIHYPTYDTLTQTACYSILVNGQTYTTSGNYTQTLTNSLGCDSILSLNIVINHGQSYTWVDGACDYYVTFYGTVITQSGTYVEYEPNNWGCNDTVTYIITITPSNYYSGTVHACGSYTCNGVVYTQSDPCYFTVGCDEYDFFIVINNPTSDYDDITACNSYTTFGGNTYYSSGTYLNWIEPEDPMFGDCEVYHYINLTIIPTPDTTVTQNGTSLTVNATGVQYQWIDCFQSTPIPGATNQTFTPTINGYYAVIVTENVNNCTNTSGCHFVSGLALESSYLQTQIQAYPNPTEGLLMLDLGNVFEDIEVKVTDLVGKVVSTTSYELEEVLEVEMPVISGVYFVSVKLGNGEMVTVKVVRE